MNKLTFDGITNYPFSIERLEELQHNLSAAADVLLGQRPAGACILSGCEAHGKPGYVRVPNNVYVGQYSTGIVYEVFEVEADSDHLDEAAYKYLVLNTSTVAIANSEADTVNVSQKRTLRWSNSQNSALANVDTMKRAYLRVGPQDTDWGNCTYGTSNGCNDLGTCNGGITSPEFPKARIKDGNLEIRGFFGISQYANYERDKPLFLLPGEFTDAITHDLIIPVTIISASDCVSAVAGGWAVIHKETGLNQQAACRLSFETSQLPVLSINASIPL